MEFRDKTVVISGASRGIGADAARVFAAAGANVVLLARSAEALEALAQEIGEKALALACDVADYAAVDAAFARAHAVFGSLDVLICNAGMIEPISRLEQAEPDAWAQLINVNITGVFNMMRAGLPHLKAAGGGSVLTIGSGASQRPLEGWSAYCTSKAGAAMLTQALHLEEAANGIRVMGLSPGTVATQMQREIKASGINPVSQLDWEDHIPAEWPARTLLWMCSADADDFVGTEISLRDEGIRKRVGLI
ncbi:MULTISPECIES: SDR family oxidoreductase [unclassified Epibacterium]|jgi:NAD(P)-dependent dehydrogenase (short-subunit alcohol dehydrogenase family)|uniref:SDR family oxidoreductase n=1 Tax=unclassified Epibacterium TaxID=2639179 RepID=UPI001EF59CCC|nr:MULTISPECIES: SDR family NAD(P)-dependent oxidoreductase [unclassified Epibacterium]MCG7625528.1 SDR family oxidoreductase [Epibacterium sp. Ofav1-8]MCG7629785.1 SDR family oxidoreductase [Epibacterium sp. MM17-32]